MFKDRVFNLAILLSIICHIFWLSVITVVVTPKEMKPIKFSKVSFLGPILERGALEVRIKPRERSILEKLYLSDIGDFAFTYVRQVKVLTPQEGRYTKDFDTKFDHDEKLLSLIEDAVNNPKIEPLYNGD